MNRVESQGNIIICFANFRGNFERTVKYMRKKGKFFIVKYSKFWWKFRIFMLSICEKNRKKAEKNKKNCGIFWKFLNILYVKNNEIDELYFFYLARKNAILVQ